MTSPWPGPSKGAGLWSNAAQQAPSSSGPLKLPARPVPDHPLWLALIPIGYLVSFAYGNWLNSTQCITNSAIDFLQRSMGMQSTVQYLDYWEARTICIDPYWVNQWLKNYSAGLVKRGLLGTGLGTLSPGEINILLLNLIGFLIPIAIFALTAFTIRAKTRKSWLLISAFLALVALSPFGKVLAETSGDPLQVVCLIVFVSLTILIGLRQQLNAWAIHLGVALTYLISVLIYEGSFLLLLPMLAISKGRLQQVISLVSIGLGATLIWQFSGAESGGTGDLIASSYSGYNPITDHSIRYIHSQNLAASASFFFNVKQEFSKYMEDPYGSIRWIGTAATMSLFFMLSFANFVFQPGNKVHRLFTQNWLAISVCGLPFFLITHDWFRYGTIVITLAIALLIPRATSLSTAPQQVAFPRPTAELAVLFLLAVIAAAIGPHQLDVRRGIVPIIFWQAYGGMAAVAALTLWRLLRNEATASKRVPYSLID